MVPVGDLVMIHVVTFGLEMSFGQAVQPVSRDFQSFINCTLKIPVQYMTSKGAARHTLPLPLAKTSTAGTGKPAPSLPHFPNRNPGLEPLCAPSCWLDAV